MRQQLSREARGFSDPRRDDAVARLVLARLERATRGGAISVEGGTVILLVEDDPAHAELARRALEKTAGTFSSVETLGQARAWLKARSPDVVVSDLRLPDGTAIELLEDDVP